MKKFIKKMVAAALSAAGIFSAVPPAFCVPGEANNARGNLDCYNAMIVAKYFESMGDIANLEMTNKKYRGTLEKFYYNIVGIDMSKQQNILPRMQTYYVGKGAGDFFSTFPNDNIKSLIYLPGSFNVTQFKNILIENEIIDENGKSTLNWDFELEINGGNPMNGCRAVFASCDDKKITFLFEPCMSGSLNSLRDYNDLIQRCSLGKIELQNATINLPRDFSIPDYVTSVGNEAFDECSELRSVTIPSSVKAIGNAAFRNCLGLGMVNIPNSVTSIGNEAFKECALGEINIPNSVASIGGSAFESCRWLRKILVPNSVKSLGEGAFCNCYNLKEVVIPNSVTSIADYTFLDCSSLKEIVIPDSVTSLGEGVFKGCISLERIYIPTSLKSLGKKPFEDCHNLRSIEFNGKIYDNLWDFMVDFYKYIRDYKA